MKKKAEVRSQESEVGVYESLDLASNILVAGYWLLVANPNVEDY